MYAPDEHFMAVGRDQIRDWAIGIEMDGLDGWHYDYQATVIDEQKAHDRRILEAEVRDPRRRPAQEYEILGIGGSWFGVERQTTDADAGQIKIAWQRDWFDMPSTAHTFMEILKAGKAPDTLLKRMSVAGHGVPGHYHHKDLPSHRLAAAGRARRLRHPGSRTDTSDVATGPAADRRQARRLRATGRRTRSSTRPPAR